MLEDGLQITSIGTSWQSAQILYSACTVGASSSGATEIQVNTFLMFFRTHTYMMYIMSTHIILEWNELQWTLDYPDLD